MIIVIIIVDNPRYSYKGYHLLGPRNWGTEKQSELYKGTQQMGKRQSQSQAWTEPYAFPACPGAWFESSAARQKVISIYQTPRPWGFLQRAGQWQWIQWCWQSTKQRPSVCRNGNSTADGTTGPHAPKDAASAWLCLGLPFNPGQLFPFSWGSRR